MSYEPTNWKTGDVVTSAKLNKLEQAVAQRGLILTGLDLQNNKNTLNKTWQEIFDAVSSGCFVVAIGTAKVGGETCFSVYPLYTIENSPEGYAVTFGPMEFVCVRADDYPTTPDKARNAAT